MIIKTLAISLLAVFWLFFINPIKIFSKSPDNNQISVDYTEYTIRLNLSGKWYLITYNSDGYIVNIVEDDE